MPNPSILQRARPGVGLGIVIVDNAGKVLVGKRTAMPAKWSIPGGHFELGETFENGAIREVKEETNLDVSNPRVIAVTNNLETYRAEGKHYISIILLATAFTGTLENMEPDKCEEWRWVDPANLPEPHFDASRFGVRSYLSKSFYEGPS